MNLAIKSSQGKYIARQDYDDISLPNRLEKQFFFLENNTEYIFCSSNFFKINKVGSRLFSRKINISHNKIKKILEYKNIFSHSSVFFSKKFFDKVGGYNENFIFSQDFELWTRLIKFGKFKLIQEKLIELRIHDKSLSHLNNKKQRIYSFFIGLKYIFPTLEELNKSINSQNFLSDLENLCQHNKGLYYLFQARKYIYLYDEVNFFSFLTFSLNSIISIIIILLHRPNYILLRIFGK